MSRRTAFIDTQVDQGLAVSFPPVVFASVAGGQVHKSTRGLLHFALLQFILVHPRRLSLPECQ